MNQVSRAVGSASRNPVSTGNHPSCGPGHTARRSCRNVNIVLASSFIGQAGGVMPAFLNDSPKLSLRSLWIVSMKEPGLIVLYGYQRSCRKQSSQGFAGLYQSDNQVKAGMPGRLGEAGVLSQVSVRIPSKVMTCRVTSPVPADNT